MLPRRIVSILRRLRVVLLGLMGSLLLWCIVIASSILAVAKTNSTATADAAIVLGAAVFDDAPSPVLAERVNHAIQLYDAGRVRKLIFTGGRSPEDTLSEAEASRRHAVERGVPDDDILLETESVRTLGNLTGVIPLMEQHGLESAIVVSDPWHLRRAAMQARRLGMRVELSGTPTTRYRSLRSKTGFLLREMWFVSRWIVWPNRVERDALRESGPRANIAFHATAPSSLPRS